MLVHEHTYRGWNPAAWVHRARLRSLERLLAALPLGTSGHLADFGCSNGFIIEHLQHTVLKNRAWRCTGLDYARELLALGEAKGLPDTEFDFVDLNAPGTRYEGAFDLVLCLETLEHVGNLPRAVQTVLRAAKPGGHIVLGVPNETGLPGLVKFVARPLVRRHPYEDFFEGRSALAYGRDLLLHRRIESWRDPAAAGWGPHLGFDHRWLDELVAVGDGAGGDYRRLDDSFTPGGFNRLLVIERRA